MLTRQFLLEDFLLTGNFRKPLSLRVLILSPVILGGLLCASGDTRFLNASEFSSVFGKWICHVLFQFATRKIIYWAPRLSYIFQLKRSWPFPSSKNSHFRNEAKFKTSLVKMKFICIWEEKNIFISMALLLALLWNRGLRRLENDRLKTKIWK